MCTLRCRFFPNPLVQGRCCSGQLWIRIWCRRLKTIKIWIELNMTCQVSISSLILSLIDWADSYYFVPNVLHLTIATLRNFECYITYICSTRQIHRRRFRHLYPPTGCTPRWCNKFHSLSCPRKRRWRTSQCWRWGKLKTGKRLMLEEVYPRLFFCPLFWRPVKAGGLQCIEFWRKKIPLKGRKFF